MRLTLFLGAALAVAVLVVTTNVVRDLLEPRPEAALSLVLLLAGGSLGSRWWYRRMLRPSLASRNRWLGVDAEGLWAGDGDVCALVPWSALAGVGLHWAMTGPKGGVTYSVELCPSEPVDPDHPVLWRYVRREEPPRPGLPELRYRFLLPGRMPRELRDELHRHASHLWFGEVESPDLHLSEPDAEDHERRTRGRL